MIFVSKIATCWIAFTCEFLWTARTFVCARRKLKNDFILACKYLNVGSKEFVAERGGVAQVQRQQQQGKAEHRMETSDGRAKV